jgi:hypothetical protein
MGLETVSIDDVPRRRYFGKFTNKFREIAQHLLTEGGCGSAVKVPIQDLTSSTKRGAKLETALRSTMFPLFKSMNVTDTSVRCDDSHAYFFRRNLNTRPRTTNKIKTEEVQSHSTTT